MSVPIQTLSTLQPLTASNTNFGTNLFNAVAQGGDQNIFFSPSSIATTARMLMNGAGGSSLQALQQNFGIAGQPSLQTLNELERKLRGAIMESMPIVFSGGDGILEPQEGGGYAGVIQPRKGEVKEMQLKIANAIWGGPAATPNKSLVEIALRDYGAKIDKVGIGEERKINAWISMVTEGNINDLLPPGLINAMTAVILSNAIYFKGQWKNPFEKGNTADGQFQTLNGNVTVPMMHTTADFRYLEAGGLQMIELPYNDGNNDVMAPAELGMLIALPESKMSAMEFSRKYMMERTLLRSIEELPLQRCQEANLTMPRFKMNCPLDLKAAFSAMGMGVLFDQGQADLFGLVENAPAKPYISDALHRAIVEVNEEGTVAAAATAFALSLECMHYPVNMVIDRPFFFMIRHFATPLFMGWMARP